MSLSFAVIVSDVIILITLVSMALLPEKLLWIEVMILFMFGEGHGIPPAKRGGEVSA
jgi:hypothetical protein